MNTLLIRADAGPGIGVGHVMRMVALSEAWLSAGHGPAVIAGSLGPLAARIEASGAQALEFPSSSLDNTLALARQVRASHIVLDGYGFPVQLQSALRHDGFKLGVVDDNAENGCYDADVVVNVNLHAREAAYPGKVGRFLLGTTYALVRREFHRRTISPEAGRWLLSMGGADPIDATGLFLRRLSRKRRLTCLVGPANPRIDAYRQLAREGVDLLFNPSSPSEAMARCEFAVTAAGGTVWELALLGIASAVVSLADNQVALAQALEARGAARYIGDARGADISSDTIDELEWLGSDNAARAKLVTAARSLVDGEGAMRVAQALMEV